MTDETGDDRPAKEIREAVVPYITRAGDSEAPSVTTRLSSKNQVTLPVAVVRRLALRPGDELEITTYDGAIQLRKRLEGDELLDWLEGSMSQLPEWRDDVAVREYVRGERESWERDHG